MYLNGIGTANPPRRYTKFDCLSAFQNSEWYVRLDARARFVAHTVLQRDNGIEARRLALDSLSDAFVIDPDTLSERFLTYAPALAIAAATSALRNAGIAPADIDAIVVSTCTGYVCPALSGYVIQALGLRADTQAFDLVGQGCAAALPNMQLGHALLRPSSSTLSDGCKHVLSVCVEVSSAAMYLDDDPGVIISACLFGDGAGAAVLSRQPTGSRQIEWIDSVSLIDPSERKALMFEQRKGMLRNVLTRAVPSLAAQYARRVLDTSLNRGGLRPSDVVTWIMHAGGRDVLLALEREFELQPRALHYSAAILREYGNMSSAFVYFVLQEALADHAPGGYWWLSSFGAGFSCHGALLRVAPKADVPLPNDGHLRAPL
ncbi:3-oxoacyl-ACP synthase [Caballeronia arationis]|uniref:type III polyketide synthase n=1 Tax=Caballeronia arationis TaxID=1777142 RepID=UPI00074C0BA0|nr:3-oxoacyl-[acyl-carrier-protein] synthase III C-terminal domain-containing protein [Caballeronia arationis]SAL01402.1 3-oxoacyl-ACP synthase [Caballeronia arationis]